MERTKINNKSSNYANYKYVVYRVVDGENWFWDAYNTLEECVNVIHMLGKNARITESENVER